MDREDLGVDRAHRRISSSSTSASASTTTAGSSTGSAACRAAASGGPCAAAASSNPRPKRPSIGPITLRDRRAARARCAFILEPNNIQPISFDVVLSGVTPPFFENRNLVRSRRTNRIDVNVIRYHQGGFASGERSRWTGTTHEIRPNQWFGFRDHSYLERRPWDSPPHRSDHRVPETDRLRRPSTIQGGMKDMAMPTFFRRPDGTLLRTAIFVTEGAWHYSSAYINDARRSRSPGAPRSCRASSTTRARAIVRGGELHLHDGERQSSA